MFNAKHNLLPLSFSHHVRFATITHRNNFRLTYHFERIDYRTLVRERYIGIACPKLWNALPNEIKIANSLYMFKTMLKDYFIKSYE